MGANAKRMMIEFEMAYPEKGVFFIARVRYTEQNWWAVMRLHRARNIKVVSN